MRRWISYEAAKLWLELGGFNGATAMRRWIWAGVPNLVATSLNGFNGATAMRRWIYPKPMPTDLQLRLLQWGHRYEAVDMSLSAPTEKMRALWLQWGHRYEAVDIRACSSAKL